MEQKRIEKLDIMKKHSNSRNGFIHLYNPKEEGLGTYDMHYINAYKKDKNLKQQLRYKSTGRYAA